MSRYDMDVIELGRQVANALSRERVSPAQVIRSTGELQFEQKEEG